MKLTKEQITAAAKTVGLDYATVAAVAKVESSGGGFADPVNPKFPKILFEGHIFSKRTGGEYDMSHPRISYPKWTKQFYSKTQAGEQGRLEEAVALNREAALQSASYGMFQIMGFNYAMCGCKSVQEFVNENCKSEHRQLELFLIFIEKMGYVKFLKEKNWVKFAKAYNGPAYSQNKYDVKLAESYGSFIRA